jgi:hypothetical protein
VEVATGNTVDGDSAAVNVFSGSTSGNGNSGDVNIQSGTSSGGTRGKVKLSAEIVNITGHVETVGSTPTFVGGDCGTSPAIVGNDGNGRITVGSGGTDMACSITFANPVVWSNVPVCHADDETTFLLLKPTPGSTTLVISSATPLGAGDSISYHCEGY